MGWHVVLFLPPKPTQPWQECRQSNHPACRGQQKRVPLSAGEELGSRRDNSVRRASIDRGGPRHRRIEISHPFGDRFAELGVAHFARFPVRVARGHGLGEGHHQRAASNPDLAGRMLDRVDDCVGAEARIEDRVRGDLLTPGVVP